MKNPDKMSERELRNEVKTWRNIGTGLLNQVDDWSTGVISRTAFINEELEETIKELVE